MKIIFILLVVLLSGCAGTSTTRYGDETQYQIKDGFLQPANSNALEGQKAAPIKSTINASATYPVKAPETAIPPAPEPILVKRTSKRVQEQLKRIQKILEKP